MQIAHYTKLIAPFFHAARVGGELCGRANDIQLRWSWINSNGINDGNGPNVWTKGNILIVGVGITTQISCSPGTLTVTASLDGVQVGDPVMLVLSLP